MEQPYLEMLYEEIAHHVFSFLPLDEVFYLESVSKNIRAKLHNFLKKIIELNINDRIVQLVKTPLGLEYLRKHFTRLQSIDLRPLGEAAYQLDLEQVAYTIRSLPSFSPKFLLWLPPINAKTLPKPLVELYNIIPSALTSVFIAPGIFSFDQLVEAVNLRRLTISSFNYCALVCNFVPQLSCLQNLRISNSEFKFSPSLKLSHKVASNHSTQNTEEIEYEFPLLDYCRDSLVTLEVTQVRGLNKSDFWMHLPKCTSLTCFIVQSVENFNRDHLFSVPRTNLHSLVLSSTPNLNIDDVVEFITGCEKLQMLGLGSVLLGDKNGVIKIDNTSIGPRLKGALNDRVEPFWVAALYTLSRYYANTAQWELEIECLDLALERYPTNFACLVAKGDALYFQSNYEAALECFSSAAEIDPSDSLLWHKLGSVFDKLQQPEDAIKCFMKAIELNPKAAWSYHCLTSIFVIQKQYEKALEFTDLLLKIAGDDPRNWCLRGTLLKKLRRYEEAHVAFDKAISLRQDEVYWFGKGECYRKQQLEVYAIEAFRNALKLNPKHVPALNSIGLCYSRLGLYAIAVQYYDEALKHWPNDLVIWCNKGEALFMTGHYSESIMCCDKALELAGEDNEATTSFIYVRKAKCFILMGNFENAIQCLDKALAIDPQDASAWEWRGRAMFEQGEFQESLKCYENALKMNPDDIYALGGQALALSGIGRFDEALSCIDKAIALEPDNDLSYRWKGRILMKKGDKEEAIKAFDTAIQLCYKHTPDHLYRRGMAYFGKGDYENAQKTFAEGLKLDPNDSDAWFDRGESLRHLGRIEEAVACYKKALELCPFYMKAQRAIMELTGSSDVK